MGALEITDCRVRLYNRPDDKLKAFATITFNDCFVVTDLKVIQGNTGQFVAMPSRKRRDGKFRDVAHPLNSSTREMIEKCVLALYNDELKAAENGGGDGGDEGDGDDEGDGGNGGAGEDDYPAMEAVNDDLFDA